MKCVPVLLIVLIVRNELCFGKSYFNLERGKRQEEKPWVWGHTDDVTNGNTNTEVRQGYNATDSEEPNPCTPFVSKKPDFSNGRRISEAKCFEYIWELKNRHDVEKHSNDCFWYTIREQEKRGVGRPHFAIGGRDTLPGEFPHMGALGWRAVIGTWLFMCGSSLISSKFLLTAAHCTQIPAGDSTVVDTTPEIVRLGDKNIIDDFANGQEPKDLKILRLISHPQYNPPKKYYDIALVELVQEVTFDKYIQPACLWSKPDTSSLGTKASLTGWGYVDSARLRTSPELQAAFVDIIDSSLCDELLRPLHNRHFKGIAPHQICAGVLAGGVDSCQGDSGGPLQVKIPLPITTQGSMSYVIGVTSFGFGCARANTPGVYTRVSSFVDWIESIVWA